MLQVIGMRRFISSTVLRTPVPTAAAPHWEIEPSWALALKSEISHPSFQELQAFVEAERQTALVVPPPESTFAAFESCPFDRVSVVVLGQDPYPTPGHAHGLAVSVEPEVTPIPGSLRNIYAELSRDVGVPPASHGCLETWGEQGVLLLNSFLSTRAGEKSGAHAGQGWERLTDGAVAALSAKRTGLVFMLWGRHAQRKAALIDQSAHLVLRAAHPSPLSANRGFHGCAHFSACNRYLEAQGRQPIDWAAHLATSTRTSARASSALPAPTALSPAAQAATTVEESPQRSRAGHESPHQWWKQLQSLERARSARNAPVDFLGCHLQGNPADGEPAFRFQTLIALILSTRTQDATLEQAMGRLRTLAAPLDDSGRLTAAALAELEDEIVGRALLGVTYSRVKAERVVRVAEICRDEHSGDVPRELSAVLKLPGVGPKVAHLLMQVAWGETHGVAVDTHVHRISARLGWTKGAKNAEATRKQLETWLPKEHWQALNPLMVGFGQQICSETPQCRRCRLAADQLCPQIGVENPLGL